MGARQSSLAVRINAMHQKDKTAGMLIPWVSVTPTSELDKDKDYFCVATWGTMGAWRSGQFWTLTKGVGQELHALPQGQLVGETRQIQPGILDFRGETFTVWHERAHMAAFYKSGAHQHAMTTMRDVVNFRVRRVWVKGSDVPKAGDSAATRAFVHRIKSGGFPEAAKAGKAAEPKTEPSELGVGA